MKSRAERLDYIIDQVHVSFPKKLKDDLLALFKECVPEEGKKESFFLLGTMRGYNLARQETLKNIEEMGK